MLVTARNAVSYLVDEGLMEQGRLLDEDLVVEELPHRNRNFRVRLGRDDGVFLKQAVLMDPTSVETFRGEARAYRALQEGTLGVAMEGRIPRLLAHDEERQVLAIELLSGRESLGECHRRLLRFPAEAAGSLGDALGRLHRASRSMVSDETARRGFSGRIPWVLNAGRPEAIPLHTQMGGSLQLMAIVQRYPEIRDQLDPVRAGWRAEALIHGDVKWDNCLVSVAEDGTPTGELHLIDWEMADVGDPAWDVGGVLQSYLSFWVFCLPAAKGSTTAQMIRSAPFTLESMHPALREFWRGYREAAGLGTDADRFLRASARYAAARAIQTAYESLPSSPQLTPQAVLLLQISSNMLARTEDAIHELIGL